MQEQRDPAVPGSAGKTAPHITGDSFRLKQLLTILLDNAVSYTPEDRGITISGAANGNELTISVADQVRRNSS